MENVCIYTVEWGSHYDVGMLHTWGYVQLVCTLVKMLSYDIPCNLKGKKVVL